jgi:hypothetical protein
MAFTMRKECIVWIFHVQTPVRVTPTVSTAYKEWSGRFAGWLRELKLYTVVITLALVLVYTDSHNTMGTAVSFSSLPINLQTNHFQSIMQEKWLVVLGRNCHSIDSCLSRDLESVKWLCSQVALEQELLFARQSSTSYTASKLRRVSQSVLSTEKRLAASHCDALWKYN